MTVPVEFTAPCPQRHPNAAWVQRCGDGKVVNSNDFTITCAPCDTHQLRPAVTPPAPARPAPPRLFGYRWHQPALAVLRAVWH